MFYVCLLLMRLTVFSFLLSANGREKGRREESEKKGGIITKAIPQ